MTTIHIDVLLHIIEFIDHPEDLLSFALTARALHAAIVPRHIDYRRISISCTKSSEHVWKHLLDTPYACSCIRYLNILISHGRIEIPRTCRIESESNPRRPPPLFGRDDNLDHISDTFVQALSKMVNLKVLKFQMWGRNDEVSSLISEAIGKAGCDLEELEVHFKSPNIDPFDLNADIEQRFEEDKVSKDLKTFSLFYDYLPSVRKYVIESGYQYNSGVVLQMLLNTPNLSYMNVASGLSTGSAFFSGYWPNLQYLNFHNCQSCPTGKDYGDYLPCLRTFLHRHSRLITLLTHDVLLPGWAIESDDFLSNLKSFYINLELQPLTITTNITARLTHLRMNTGLYRYLKERGIILSNLETCVYWGACLEESIQDLVDMAPNIQKLCLTFEPILYIFDPESDSEEEQLIPDHEYEYVPTTRRSDPFECYIDASDEIMKRIPLFAGFKNLRVLIGPFDGISVDSHPPFKVLYDFPKLLYTRIGLKPDDLKYFRLERDDIAKVMRFEHEEVCPDECNLFSWDGLYRHDREDWLF